MAVNGIEIKVGQVWHNNEGTLVRIETSPVAPYPFRSVCVKSGAGQADHMTDGGTRTGQPEFTLVELVKDEHGFTLWRGGEQPEETKGKHVAYRLRDGAVTGQPEPAESLDWDHDGAIGKDCEIVAYKIVDAVEEPTDSHALAAEMLSDLGYHFDGQGWVRDESTPQLELPGVPAAPLDIQVGGSHYKSLAIQPIEYTHANGIPFAEGSVIKYVTRWRAKNGIKDLEKARHFIDLLIQLEQRAQEGGAQ